MNLNPFLRFGQLLAPVVFFWSELSCHTGRTIIFLVNMEINAHAREEVVYGAYFLLRALP